MHAIPFTLSIVDSLCSVPSDQWDAMVGDYPFQRHAFFSALHDSGCLDGERPWVPLFVLAHDADGVLAAGVSAWGKFDSFGEFVHDWPWAQLAHRAHLPYYPKVVITSPFTPATGPRLHVRPDLEATMGAALRGQLVDALQHAATLFGASGVHGLFCDEPSLAALQHRGYFVRESFQYHWQNPGWSSFDDFLGALRSKRRKEVLRERRIVAEQGVRVVAVEGADLDDTQLQAVFGFYSATCRRYAWGRQYLNLEFFERIRATMPESVLVFLAYAPDGELVAGTWSLRSKDRIWGRYWGASRDVPMLHFETCYYRPIEWAIEHGIAAMEPGAGGDHKVARGFDPVRTRSAHRFLHPDLDRVLRSITAQELRMVEDEEQLVRSHTSFRRVSPP
jgi:predicted N-acyltransferase